MEKELSTSKMEMYIAKASGKNTILYQESSILKTGSKFTKGSTSKMRFTKMNQKKNL